MNVCFLIPHYEHIELLPEVVEGLLHHRIPVLVVDDGSSATTRTALDLINERHERVEIIARAQNDGKGAALKTGYRIARERGFTHVIQIDADAQHDLADIDQFLSVMQAHPDSLVLGAPKFDSSIPRVRLHGRKVSIAMVWLLTLSRQIPDPLCGFRGVPLEAALRVLEGVHTGNRMDFDPEFAVRMKWDGVRIKTIDTRIRYPRDRYISHFRMVADNVALTTTYTRLTLEMLRRIPLLLGQRPAQPVLKSHENGS